MQADVQSGGKERPVGGCRVLLEEAWLGRLGTGTPYFSAAPGQVSPGATEYRETIRD